MVNLFNGSVVGILVPILPLMGWALLTILRPLINKRFAGFLATFLVFMSFVLTVLIAFRLDNMGGEWVVPIYQWLSIGPVTFSFSLLYDPLSLTLALIVTGVGALIHLYSVGYMKDDLEMTRFFGYLNLFSFFMLVLVLSDSFLGMFVGWEGVGLASYLLIGFWYRVGEFHKAAKKAFLMNRIGDIGFIMALFYMLSVFGTSTYSVVFSHAAVLAPGSLILTVITVLLFIGVTGKSAQIPLYTWLPDAMAGPTPVSALIHAATMVIAGIYLIARSHILFALAPFTLMIIVGVGVATALLAAVIAIGQTDIKKVLAYSTVSQLGFMVATLGMGAYVVALFHMITHAFFKALMFLGSGNVIHALHGEQNVYKMGGLRKSLPFTSSVFLIGVLAISGMPPLSGFFSKDEILIAASHYSWVVFGLLALGSVLTAFYMLRLYFLVFEGQARHHAHPHEGSWEMQVPLAVLAVLACVGGVLNFPGRHYLSTYLEGVFASLPGVGETGSHSLALVMLVATLLLLPLIGLSAKWYASRQVERVSDTVPTPLIPQFVVKLFYVDQIYVTCLVRPYLWMARVCDRWLEVRVIDGVVQLVSSGTVYLGGWLRRIQTGNVGVYILGMLVGLCVMIWMVLR